MKTPNELKELHIDQTVFAGLLNNHEDLQRVYEVCFTTIMLSFRVIDTAALGKPTLISQEEVKRRWKICEKWFRTMRGELGFSLNRTLDSIPEALTCELTDQEFKPDGRVRGYAATADALKRSVIIDE